MYFLFQLYGRSYRFLETKKEEKKAKPKKDAPAEKVYKIGDTVDVSNRAFKVNSV
jgi:hypothetical protein